MPPMDSEEIFAATEAKHSTSCRIKALTGFVGESKYRNLLREREILESSASLEEGIPREFRCGNVENGARPFIVEFLFVDRQLRHLLFPIPW